MSETTRIIVAIDSHHPSAWEAAIALADRLCASHQIDEAVLLIHTKAQLNRTGLTGFIGERQAKLLNRGNQLTMPSGAKLRCETRQTLRFVSRPTVVIVYYAESGILDHVDGLPQLAAVIAVPEFEDSADGWEERWQPQVLGRATRAAANLIPDPVLERALTALTKSINLSTGLIHPSDQQLAKDTLRILRAHKHTVERSKLKSWAVTKGWQPKHAEELATLAERILGQATTPSLTNIANAKERYESWT